jgi:thioredoxin reductase
MHDAIIVGRGPAGLAAALTLGRSHRRVLLLDAGQGRNAPAAAVHNLLAHDGTPPEKLRRIGREQLTRYPSVELRQGTVDGAHALADEGFRLHLGGGERVEARRLLLATGLADELPAIDGLAPLWGRSAFHCQYCHGGELLDRDAVFIATVLHQRSDLADRLGCTTLADGCVEVDELARTSVPGVYAAGDMAHRAALPRPFAAVSWASASGTLAGAMLDQDLVEADFSLQAPGPVPGPRTAPAGQDGRERAAADAISK